MKRPAKMALILAVGIVVLIIAGCGEQNLLVIRKSRLILDENEQLKGQLEKCKEKNEQQKELSKRELEKQKEKLEKKNEQQKELFEKELEKQEEKLERKITNQKRLLDKCLRQKRVLANNTEDFVQGRLDGIFKGVMGENVKLRQENKELKAEIKRLREEAEKEE